MVSPVRDDGGGLPGQVCGQPGSGQPDDGQPAARRKQLAHPVEGGAGVHVVQRRDRGDHAERGGRERTGAEVAADQTDRAARVLAACQVQARCVPVEADDVRDRLERQ
jgi:hypothetical protein